MVRLTPRLTGRRGALCVRGGAAVVGDAGDLLRGALELLVGEHRGALERQVARDLEERAAAAVVVADLDRHRPRDAVGAQQEHVQRVVALPRQALLGVVGRPHVEGRELLDRATIGHGPGPGDLGPGADPHTIGLMDPAVLRQRVRRRLALGPDALLEGAPELGLVGLAHQVTTLVIERGVEEEAIVLDLEVLVGLADAALAQSDELLALREGAHSDSPFLECNWHRSVREGGSTKLVLPRLVMGRNLRPDGTSHTMHKVPETHNIPANRAISSNRTDSGETVRADFPVRPQTRVSARPSTTSSTAAKSCSPRPRPTPAL